MSKQPLSQFWIFIVQLLEIVWDQFVLAALRSMAARVQSDHGGRVLHFNRMAVRRNSSAPAFHLTCPHSISPHILNMLGSSACNTGTVPDDYVWSRCRALRDFQHLQPWSGVIWSWMLHFISSRFALNRSSKPLVPGRFPRRLVPFRCHVELAQPQPRGDRPRNTRISP